MNDRTFDVSMIALTFEILDCYLRVSCCEYQFGVITSQSNLSFVVIVAILIGFIGSLSLLARLSMSYQHGQLG